MDYKRALNILGVLCAIVGGIFQLVVWGYWYMAIIILLLFVIALAFISNATARISIGVFALITSCVDLGFKIWMLSDLVTDRPAKIYHPIIFIVLDVLVIGASVLLILLRNAQLKGKECNPVINKLIELENRD